MGRRRHKGDDGRPDQSEQALSGEALEYKALAEAVLKGERRTEALEYVQLIRALRSLRYTSNEMEVPLEEERPDLTELIFADILRQREPERSESQGEGTAESITRRITDASESLGQIATLSSLRNEIQLRLQKTVDHAREAGATWKAIGTAAGVTPQAAYRRWDAEARRKNAGYKQRRAQ